MTATTIEASRKELATRGDIQDVRNEIQDVRAEIQLLRNEIAETKHEILKWVLGMLVAQTTLIITALGVGVALLNR